MSKDGESYKLNKVKMPPQKKKVKKKPVRKVIPKKTIPPREAPKEPPAEPEEKPVVRTRKKITLETHLQKYEELLELIEGEIDRKSREKEKGTRTLQKMRKLIKELKREAPKISKAKRKRTSNGNRVSGFAKTYKINTTGAKFLQLEEGTLLSRTALTNAICVYIHFDPADKREHMQKWAYLNPEGKRDLQKTGERMIIEPDAALSNLLKYDDYKKRVKNGEVMTTVTKRTPTGVTKTKVVQEDDALYYRVMQKLIDGIFDK